MAASVKSDQLNGFINQSGANVTHDLYSHCKSMMDDVNDRW